MNEHSGNLPPSGRWVGYYLYSAGGVRHRQKMRLSFRSGIVGSGNDGVGTFTIRGRFDPETNEARWQKRYATHEVSCRGFYENESIWGVWNIGNRASGGFRIWPCRGQMRRIKIENVVEAILC